MSWRRKGTMMAASGAGYKDEGFAICGMERRSWCEREWAAAISP